jgi:protein-S-isoprenylcysteine O-methyltransferase Ste14
MCRAWRDGYCLKAGGSGGGQPLWLIPFAIFVAYFIFIAMREEKNMTRHFPAAYPDYRKRTWMLIPLLL